MTRAVERYSKRIRFFCQRLVIAGVSMAIAPLAGHAQSSFEHATKDKVQAALPKLEEVAQRIIANDGVPGISIAIVFQDEVIYLKASASEKKARVSQSTPIRCFSLPRSPSPWPRPSRRLL